MSELLVRRAVGFCLGISRHDVGTREVLVRAVPTALPLAAQEHHNTLMRECLLHQQAAQATPDQAQAPGG